MRAAEFVRVELRYAGGPDSGRRRQGRFEEELRERSAELRSEAMFTVRPTAGRDFDRFTLAR